MLNTGLLYLLYGFLMDELHIIFHYKKGLDIIPRLYKFESTPYKTDSIL